MSFTNIRSPAMAGALARRLGRRSASAASPRWCVKNPCGQRRAGADAYLLSSLLSVKLAGFRTLIARRQQTL